jgi:hypothetical protein
VTDQATDIAPVTDDESQIMVNDSSSLDVDAWWSDPNADDVDGSDFLKDVALMELVGVPFLAYRVTFRDGIQRKGAPFRDDYVSIEVHVAPEPIMRNDAARIISRRVSAKIPADSPAARPNELLGVNDGSTGLYRQIVQYLAAKGTIELPAGPTVGEKGDTIYDLPRSAWVSGAEVATEGIAITLRCSRGLRFSEYKNDYTGDESARTWYIA